MTKLITGVFMIHTVMVNGSRLADSNIIAIGKCVQIIVVFFYQSLFEFTVGGVVAGVLVVSLVLVIIIIIVIIVKNFGIAKPR